MKRINVYFDCDTSIERHQQGLMRILSPLLNQLLGPDVPKEIKVDNKYHLCINGTPVGDCRNMSNFHADKFSLGFNYHKKIRYVCFGVRGLDEKYYNVQSIFDCINGNMELVYDSFKEDLK